MDDAILKRIAEKYGTPTYVYDGALIREKYREFRSAFKTRYKKTRILYACKANTSLAIMDMLKKEGAGVDVVSGGELDAALKVGFKPDDILYTSNSKTMAELEMAIDSGIIVNLDSADELETINGIGKKARVSFRVNPSVNPKTHEKIATGLKESKFGLHMEKGIALKAYRKASGMENVEIAGVHAHIGSQITDMDAFGEAAEKLMNFALELKDVGITVGFVDIGGGLGIRYKDENARTPADLASVVCPVISERVKELGYEPELWLEPGRYLVAEAGILLTGVNSVKRTPYRNFINVDCGFNTLLRPSMYDSYHGVRVVGKTGDDEAYDIAGNVCESGDILARDRKLPKVAKGDLIAILNAGAYGFSMASTYNSQPLPAEVMVDGSRVNLIRERGTYDDLYAGQKLG